MSDTESKEAHSWRIHKTNVQIEKQRKIAKQAGHDKYVKEPHRLAKHHALDCGNPKCIMCSSGKVFNEPTIQEKKFFQDAENIRNRHGNGLLIKHDQTDKDWLV
jgi:hypothetical protein